MRLWRALRGGHWERWNYGVLGDREYELVWLRVPSCTRLGGLPPPRLFCRGTPTCEHHGPKRF